METEKPSGQPVPMMGISHGEKTFSYNQSETLFQCKPVVSHPLVMQHCEEPVLDRHCHAAVRSP